MSRYIAAHTAAYALPDGTQVFVRAGMVVDGDDPRRLANPTLFLRLADGGGDGPLVESARQNPGERRGPRR